MYCSICKPGYSSDAYGLCNSCEMTSANVGSTLGVTIGVILLILLIRFTVKKFKKKWDLYKRAKKGYIKLLGEDSVKAVDAAYQVASQIQKTDDRIAEYRRLWKKGKMYLEDEVITYDIANDLGSALDEKKHEYDEAKWFKLAALEGYLRILGEEHNYTLASMTNMGNILAKMDDLRGALAFFQRALTVQERIMGKTHLNTLRTVLNMAVVFQDVDCYDKAEEMYMQGLEGYKASLGKDHKVRYVSSHSAVTFDTIS